MNWNLWSVAVAFGVILVLNALTNDELWNRLRRLVRR
jgi:hypothetical protein